MKIAQFVNKILVCLIIPVLFLGMTGDITIKISSPPSGLHTRSETVYIKGSVSDKTIKEVEVIFDGATVGSKILTCREGTFEANLILGAGKTSISVQALVGESYIESGIIVYRDCTVSSEINSFDVYVNSDTLSLAHTVRIVSNHSMVPLREFAGFFGAVISWNNDEKKVVVTLGRLSSSIKLGSSQGTIDSVSINCNPPATLIGGTMYLPSRFFSQMVGGGVSWDGKLKRLTVGVP